MVVSRRRVVSARMLKPCCIVLILLVASGHAFQPGHLQTSNVVNPHRRHHGLGHAPALTTRAPPLLAGIDSYYEDIRTRLPSKAVLDAVAAERGDKIIAGDVAAKAGVSLQQARKDLTTLASIAQGDIAVDKDGELLYSFPTNVESALASRSAKYRATQLARKVWPALFWLIRVSFGVTLLASIAAIFSTIFFLSSTSSSDDRDDRRSNRSSSFGASYSYNPWFGPSPFDFFYYRPYGYYGYYGRENRGNPDEMGFLESVFSYIFGDGNPNAGVDETRLRLASQVIRANQGAVTAEQLAPFCDDAPLPQSEEGNYVDESFVLPIVSALGGEPQVTEEGEIVYVFPDLQVSTSAASKLPSRNQEAMILQRAGLKPSASAAEIKQLLNYNRINSRGALERGDLIRILEKALPPPTAEEEAELALADPTVLQEREWKFSLAPDLNRFLAAGLGVVNLGGALYLGTMLNQYALYGVRLPSFYGTVQSFYPFLLGYALLYNIIPLVRNFWIQQENGKIRERNKVRRTWQTALASAVGNDRLGRKLSASRKFRTRMRQLGSSQDIVFDTSKPFEENQKKKEQQALEDFDKKLRAESDENAFQ